MELLVWDKHWGLPSNDVNSIIALAFCHIAGAPVEMKYISNKWTSSLSTYPQLKSENSSICNYEKIIDSLKNKGYDCDTHLKPIQQSDVLAYVSLIHKKLVPAIEYLFWTHTQNYLDVTRPAWSTKLPFPLSIILPIRERNRILQKHENNCMFKNLTEEARNLQMISNGKECLNILSSKLSDKSFFFGEKPTSLDALVFGLLAPLNYVDNISSSGLQVHLKCCTNLTKLCQRMLDNYFPDCALEIVRINTEKAEKEKEKIKESLQLGEFPHVKRHLFIATAVAVGSMIIYSIAMGLIHIEIINTESQSMIKDKKIN